MLCDSCYNTVQYVAVHNTCFCKRVCMLHLVYLYSTDVYYDYAIGLEGSPENCRGSYVCRRSQRGPKSRVAYVQYVL